HRNNRQISTKGYSLRYTGGNTQTGKRSWTTTECNCIEVRKRERMQCEQIANHREKKLRMLSWRDDMTFVQHQIHRQCTGTRFGGRIKRQYYCHLLPAKKILRSELRRIIS